MGKTINAACLALVLAAAGATAAAALSDGARTCPAANPIASVDLSTAPYNDCVIARCRATGAAPVAISADGQCDSTGAAEASTTVSCDAFFSAYSDFYACVLRGMGADPATGDFATNFQMFSNTPGVPIGMTNLVCDGCTHFDAVYKTSSMPAVCVFDFTCQACCGQDPTTLRRGVPGKGYNKALCGIGCTTSLLMTAFTLLSVLIFACCGCCWPSPSLKTTVERLRREQEEERAMLAQMSSDDDGHSRRTDKDKDDNKDDENDEDNDNANERAAEDKYEEPQQKSPGAAEDDLSVEEL